MTQFRNALATLVELEELRAEVRRLKSGLDKAELLNNEKEKIQAYRDLAEEAGHYQNLAAEYKVRLERKCGQVIREIAELKTRLASRNKQLSLDLKEG